MKQLDNVTNSDGMQGNFVHEGQKINEKFTNVSDIWISQCKSHETVRNILQTEIDNREDIKATVKQMKVAVNDDEDFVIRHIDGREWKPTPFALSNLAQWARCPNGQYIQRMVFGSEDEENPFTATGESREIVVQMMRFGMDNLTERGSMDPKKFVFRTYKQTESRPAMMRALVTPLYAPIDNRIVLDIMEKILPNALWSHWRGNADTLRGNVLIPDENRKEKDSVYGGMIATRNSEIGESRYAIQPSVFRAICMNGCIWDERKGVSMSMVHRKKSFSQEDLNLLKKRTEECITKQIPLISEGIDKILELRDYTCDVAGDPISIRSVIAQVSKDNGFSKREVGHVFKAYNVEKETAPRTAFSVVNAITRAGQSLSHDRLEHMEKSAGSIINRGRDGWSHTLNCSATLTDKDLDKILPSEKLMASMMS